MKNKYRITTYIVIIAVCLSIIYLHLLSHKSTRKAYLSHAKDIILESKKNFLKDTVNNTILKIDELRKNKHNNYKKHTENRLRRLEEELDLTDEEFIDFFRDKFDEGSYGMWTAYLWNSKSGEILYKSKESNAENPADIVDQLKTNISSYKFIKKGDIEGMFGVREEYIDGIVKEEIGDEIRNQKFVDDSYMWVNEVVNYEGGNDYAIRRVHPNLVYTEGTYLSTDTKDVKGNLPYLEELEGIKKNGELFLNYYFKELNSFQISEKITYAKLYKDYNWIIAMGAHLNEINNYIRITNDEIYASSSETIIRLLRYIFIVLLLGFSIIHLMGRKRLIDSTKSLENEVNLDVLTGAYSRRYGEKILKVFFKQYKSTGKNSVVMMFDVDNFKQINDKYGHHMGDIALKEVIKTINSTIRSSDQLIRWGGDEFIGIFQNLEEDYITGLGEKLLEKTSSLQISVRDEMISVTISMGFSIFRDSDDSYTDAIKRADNAMYMSKEQGKNEVNIII